MFSPRLFSSWSPERFSAQPASDEMRIQVVPLRDKCRRRKTQMERLDLLRTPPPSNPTCESTVRQPISRGSQDVLLQRPWMVLTGAGGEHMLKCLGATITKEERTVTQHNSGTRGVGHRTRSQISVTDALTGAARVCPHAKCWSAWEPTRRQLLGRERRLYLLPQATRTHSG